MLNVNKDMKIHTGDAMYLGGGSVNSTIKKIKTQRSTKANLLI